MEKLQDEELKSMLLSDLAVELATRDIGKHVEMFTILKKSDRLCFLNIILNE